MAKLSTQIEFEKLPLQDAAETAFTCFEIQTRGTETKQRAGRRAGALLNRIEESEGGGKQKKTALAEIKIPFTVATKWQKDADVPDADFERYLVETKKKAKELTDSKLRNAGRTKKQPRTLSVCGRILKHLIIWLDSKYLRSAAQGEYSGTTEELSEVATLLENLSEQFSETALKIRKNLEAQ